ncbi:hypothetical protein LC605_25720 [Nostoc sp. CHAB 5836]|uniref:hypothetical protein n=1 Tax=Nostoc sp. CHAB 5836 TaxID=2780404 RepID=UPI001E3020F9|nr:hypothetical protein [Nostoc sp. CHAB 5836]MCC5618422.1 hypothetical protein [Nostoc sp. CHAB 5836]
MKFFENFFDWRKFTQGQWFALSAVVFALLVFWSDYEQRRPSRQALQSFEEFQRNSKKLDCKFLRERQDWTEYDKQKCSSL